LLTTTKATSIKTVTPKITTSSFCPNPQVTLASLSYLSIDYLQPITKKLSDLIAIATSTKILCPSLTHTKQWTIYQLNANTGQNEKEIPIQNNPTINYAELVLQPKTLSYGLYQFIFTVTLTLKDSHQQISSQVFTYIKIEPSGLFLSTLSLIKPMYGGTIEITRSISANSI